MDDPSPLAAVNAERERSPRRRFLIKGTAAVVGAAGAARAAEHEVPADATKVQGYPLEDTSYGSRSQFETEVRTRYKTATPLSSWTMTPLQDSVGIITPSGLHFERSHGGTAVIDPAKPAGSGTVALGKLLYDAQCIACHGDKLQGGLGDKLIGGRGTLVNSDAKKGPVKTVESYWPYATTLFDYVKRAMPLYTPGSLSNDEVYAISAYILSEAKIVAADAVLDASTLPKVQMPNRDGFIADHRPESFVPVAKAPHSK